MGRGAAAGALYLLALLSKESALPLVALFAADDWLFGREARVRGAREWWRGRAILFSGHGAALILYFILRRLVLGAAGAPVYSRWPFNPLSTLDFWHRLPTAIALLGHQWRLFVWPFPLRPDYSYNTYPVVTSLLDPRLLFAVIVLVGLGALAIARWRRTPAIALGVLIHLLGISVVANIVFPIGHLFAERNLYFPSLGMCLIAALAAGALWRRWPATVWALAAVALALSMRTMDQGRIWRDNATLMANAAETTPNSTTVWAHLGEQWLLRANNPTMTASDREPFLREATACVERSLAIWPENAVALTNWARVEMVRGHVDEAVRLLDEALHFSPGFGMAVGLRLEMIRQRGDLEHLDPVISAALASDEVCIPALSALCRWRIDQGRADEAVAAGERLVHIQPFSPLFWLQLAQARQAAGDAAGAAAAEKEYQRWRWLLDEERENQSVSLR
jgi:tetratricopeptide (TPR) repeat protein